MISIKSNLSKSAQIILRSELKLQLVKNIPIKRIGQGIHLKLLIKPMSLTHFEFSSPLLKTKPKT